MYVRIKMTTRVNVLKQSRFATWNKNNALPKSGGAVDHRGPWLVRSNILSQNDAQPRKNAKIQLPTKVTSAIEFGTMIGIAQLVVVETSAITMSH